MGCDSFGRFIHSRGRRIVSMVSKWLQQTTLHLCPRKHELQPSVFCLLNANSPEHGHALLPQDNAHFQSCLPISPATAHSDLPMNFLFVKLSHHLLGLSSWSAYTRASNLVASSCRTWDMYCRSCSASCLSCGGSYIYSVFGIRLPCQPSYSQV